jgi:hypothetical protein
MAILLLVIYGIAEPTLAQPPVCEPPPKKTVTVPCKPHEGCEEKWIFVEREVPVS